MARDRVAWGLFVAIIGGLFGSLILTTLFPRATHAGWLSFMNHVQGFVGWFFNSAGPSIPSELFALVVLGIPILVALGFAWMVVNRIRAAFV